MEILQSTNYDQFNRILGNRVLNQQKISKIITDIESGFNMLPYFPLLVKKNEEGLGIIDGQHRFEAAVATSNPIYYLECDGLTLKQIALLNSRSEKWKPTDYLNCYIKLGVEDYQTLKKVIDIYKLGIGTAIDLLMFNKTKAGSSDNSLEKFRSGEFVVNHYSETVELLDLVSKLFGRYTFTMDRNLISAIQKIMGGGKCDFDVLESKINSNPMQVNKQGDTKNYIYHLEQVYNFKNQTRKVII